MPAALEATTNGATNGVKANGKIKSKNQLRRLKAKQKKAEKADTPVRKTELNVFVSDTT